MASPHGLFPARIASAFRVTASVRFAFAVGLLLLAACGGGGGGSGGPGQGGVLPDRDYGPPPPELRGPGAQLPTSFEPSLRVQNDGVARDDLVRVSVPFPWGRVHDLSGLVVDGADTAWLVLQRWPDQSIRVAQAQFEAKFAAGEVRTGNVVAGTAANGAFQPHAALSGTPIEFGAEIQGPFGVPYRAMWTGAGEVVQETPFCRVQKARLYHRAAVGTGIGRDYLTSTLYVTEFRDHSWVLVDWLLGNDYLGKDAPGANPDPNLRPLGAVDVDAASFVHRGADLAIGYRAASEGIGEAVARSDGFAAHRVLADTYLGDGQMRRWRFLLHRDDPTHDAAARASARASATASVEAPLRAVADAATWRQSFAASLLGGPIAPPADAMLRVQVDFTEWSTTPHFGAFGSHGDPVQTGQTGTPRNQPMTPEFMHALQTGDPRPQLVLEQKAWTQALRPYHLHGLRVANADPILLWEGVPIYPGSRDLSPESLGRRALLAQDPYAAFRTRVLYGPQRAHGFEPYDPEHWTCDLVFDYWTLTGDAWARDELRQLGENLRGLMRPAGYFTSSLESVRAEGWIAQGLVQCWLATGDTRYRSFLIDRFEGIVERDRLRGHPSGAVDVVRDDVRTGFPLPHTYYMPWQHGALLYGYLAAYKFFGDARFLRLCEDAAPCVAHAWVRNVVLPGQGLVPDALRYYCPASYQGNVTAPDVFDGSVGVLYGDGPLTGVHSMLLGGMLHLAEVATTESVRQQGAQYGSLLLNLPIDDRDRWDKWFAVAPAAFVP